MKPTSNLSNLKTYPVYLVCKEITTRTCMYSPQESLFLLAVLCQTIGKETRARWYYKNARRADARQRARVTF